MSKRIVRISALLLIPCLGTGFIFPSPIPQASLRRFPIAPVNVAFAQQTLSPLSLETGRAVIDRKATGRASRSLVEFLSGLEWGGARYPSYAISNMAAKDDAVSGIWATIQSLEKFASYRETLKGPLQHLVQQDVGRGLPESGQALELGAGLGAGRAMLGAAVPPGLAYTESDGNALFLKYPRAFQTNKEIVRLPRLTDYGDNSLDAILGFSMLDSFTAADLLLLMHEIFRVLKPGARFFHVQDLPPNLDTLTEELAQRGHLPLIYSGRSPDNQPVPVLAEVSRARLEWLVTQSRLIDPFLRSVYKEFLQNPSHFSNYFSQEPEILIKVASELRTAEAITKEAVAGPLINQRFAEAARQAKLDVVFETVYRQFQMEKSFLSEPFVAGNVLSGFGGHLFFSHVPEIPEQEVVIQVSVEKLVARKPASLSPGNYLFSDGQSLRKAA